MLDITLRILSFPTFEPIEAYVVWENQSNNPPEQGTERSISAV